jgi:hypothetical protein
MTSTKKIAALWLGGFALLLSAVLVLALVWPSPLQPGMVCDAQTGQVLSSSDFSGVPASVIRDAQELGLRYFPQNKTKAADMAGQLIGTYAAAADKDFIIMFNPGGWGWDPLTDIPGWESIMNGINDTLEGYGYKSLLVDYKRTRHGFDGVVGEMEVLLNIQPAKAEELAARVTFLTQNLPRLRVILTGESNGATIADDTARLLKENPRVFAIETGPPVWHPSWSSSRSLIIKNNGEQADTFSSGDIPVIVRANAESALGVYQGAQGNILLYIGAPGHYYSWDYAAVRSQVRQFLLGVVKASSPVAG